MGHIFTTGLETVNRPRLKSEKRFKYGETTNYVDESNLCPHALNIREKIMCRYKSNVNENSKVTV